MINFIKNAVTQGTSYVESVLEQFQTAKDNGEDTSIFTLTDSTEVDLSELDVNDIIAELQDLIEEMEIEDEDETETVDETSSTSSTSSTSAVSSSYTLTTEEYDEIQDEIDALTDEKEENLEKIDKIEAEIEDLSDAAAANIAAAIAQQEQAVEEQEEETKKIIKEELAAYVEANKEGGDGMTRQQLQNNISDSLGDLPGISSSVSALVEANEQINEIDSLLGDLSTLIYTVQSLETEIDTKQAVLDNATIVDPVETTKTTSSSGSSGSSCCDPIGFTVGEGDEKVQYDFIVDDGSFDTTSDFLGAENQWAAMTELDSDGDGLVTAAELSAGNIKAVKTNADGTQEIVDLAEEFGDDFSINLASYAEGGTYDGIDTTSDADGDGIVDQELLGTFDVNLGDGETVSGYNTFDDTDYLTETYGLSNDTEVAASTTNAAETGEADVETEAAAASGNLDASEFADDLQSHVNFYNEKLEEVEQLKEDLSDAWETLGLTEDELAEYNEASINEAKAKASEFIDSLDADETEETDETDETEVASTESEEAETDSAEIEEAEEEIEETLL